jgi:DNA-binding NtrC family response regulator
MSTQKILCVHDTVKELRKLSGTLEQAGYEVFQASGGTEALKLLFMENVDGVVLDYEVEAPGGVTLLSRIRHVFPEIPVLLFSDVEEIRLMPLNFFRENLDHPGPPVSLFSRMSKN